MTININELRRKIGSDDLIDHIDIHANVKPVLTELLDRLEAAESARSEDYQNWMTALDRNAELIANLEAEEKTKSDWLRANAPGGWIDDLRVECDNYKVAYNEWIEKTEWVQRGINDGTNPPEIFGVAPRRCRSALVKCG